MKTSRTPLFVVNDYFCLERYFSLAGILGEIMVSETCSVGRVPVLSENKSSCPAQVVSDYFILVHQTCFRRSIRKLAASETRSLGQSLPLNRPHLRSD